MSFKSISKFFSLHMLNTKVVTFGKSCSELWLISFLEKGVAIKVGHTCSMNSGPHPQIYYSALVD